MIECALVWSSSTPDRVDRSDYEGTARSGRDGGAPMTEVIEHELIVSVATILSTVTLNNRRFKGEYERASSS